MKGGAASSQDVARRAGVSRTTVSFVLNNTPGKTIPEETRRKVLEAARALSYTPNEKARSVAMVKHHSIGFFIPHSGYISSDAYITRVIEGMTPVLNKGRFQLVLQPLKLKQLNYLQLARQDNVDGLILMNTHDGDTGLSEIIDEGFPLVVIGSISRADVCQIDIDNAAAASAAVRHLISLGHRRDRDDRPRAARLLRGARSFRGVPRRAGGGGPPRARRVGAGSESDRGKRLPGGPGDPRGKAQTERPLRGKRRGRVRRHPGHQGRKASRSPTISR